MTTTVPVEGIYNILYVSMCQQSDIVLYSHMRHIVLEMRGLGLFCICLWPYGAACHDVTARITMRPVCLTFPLICDFNSNVKSFFPGIY